MNGAIGRLIEESVDEVNIILEADKQITYDPTTVIVGTDGNLDSLGVVSFIAAIEHRVTTAFGVNLGLVEEIANPDGPLQNLGALEAFITQECE